MKKVIYILYEVKISKTHTEMLRHQSVFPKVGSIPIILREYVVKFGVAVKLITFPIVINLRVAVDQSRLIKSNVHP